MVSEVKRKEAEEKRKQLLEDGMKSKKLNKEFFIAFEKLNNERLYRFYTDTTSGTFQNLLNFLVLVDLKLKDFYGKKKAYNSGKVHNMMEEMFRDPTEAQVKTIEKIHKAVKKLDKDTEYLDDFHFSRILDGKSFYVY